jgi:EAL domain-containing protein (putative c-di-GMP-specific phosphodiesterase class I)
MRSVGPSASTAPRYEIDGSIGWAVYPGRRNERGILLTIADGQMYATKRDTSDETVLCGAVSTPASSATSRWPLENNELLVVYQPIIDLATGTPYSAEALSGAYFRTALSCRRPSSCHTSSAHHSCASLTFVVVADALRSAQMWAKAGHDSACPSTFRTGSSTIPQFAEGLATMLQAHDVATQTRHARGGPGGPRAGGQVDEEVLGRFDALGVRLSLDDAGRAASFAALRVLPLDELKIDVGFVHGLGKSTADARSRTRHHRHRHALGLQVVAEGVETRKAWSVLAEWGCDYAQGFYVASPRPRTSSSSGLGLAGRRRLIC